MKKLVAIFLIAVLAGSVTIPNVFSDDGKNNENENDNNQSHSNTNENEHDAKENENANHGNKDNDPKIHFGFSNATSVNVVLPNGTKLTFGFSNGTNIGQQISSFVHKVRDAFKQEERQAKQIIKDCREKAKDASPADRKNIMNECKIQLKEIKKKFRESQRQFQMDFKQFREILIENNQEVHKKLEQKSDNNTISAKQHELKQKINQHGKQNGKQKRNKED